MGNAKEFISQLWWQILLLYRNNIIAISIAITSIYGLIFFLFKESEIAEGLLTTILLNDSIIIGAIFIGLILIGEKSSLVLNALMVSPMNKHLYIVSRIVAITILGVLCAMGIALLAFGLSFNLVLFAFSSFLLTLQATIIGFIIGIKSDEFMKFILKMIPILMTFSLLLLDYFDVLNLSFLQIGPVFPAFKMMITSYPNNPSFQGFFMQVVFSILWIFLLYIAAYKAFYKSTKNQ